MCGERELHDSFLKRFGFFMLVIFGGICSGELFFKLKLTKDEHRSTMNQNRLVHLIMLSTEWDSMRRINLHKVLSDLKIPPQFDFFASLISNSFCEKSDLPSIPCNFCM